MSAAAGLAAVAAALAVWLVARGVPGVEVGGGRGGRAAPAVVAVAALVVVPRQLAAPLVVLAAAGWAARLLWRRRAAARTAEAHAARMGEVCDLVAAELSAGRPPGAALDEAAAVWPVMAPVAEASRLGGDVAAAFREAARTPGAGGLGLLAAAWTVSQRTGGSLGTATSRVADAVRRDQATRRVVAAELASARATARLVAALPVLALLMGSGAGGGPWSFLLRTPGGWACLASGLTVGFAGLWWIELIAREAGG